MGKIYYNLVIKVSIYLLFSFLFWNCTPSSPESVEMVGTWKAEDGSIMQLNSDGYFVIKYLNSAFFVVLKDTINAQLDVYGKWDLREPPDSENVALSLSVDFAIRSSDSLYLSCEEKYVIRNYGIVFYIKNRNIVPNNKPKWFIRAIDTPWDYNICDFYKLKE